MVFGTPRDLGKTKTVKSGDQTISLSAARPTFQAAPTQALQLRLNAMGKRSSSRSRSLFAMLSDIRDFNPDVSKAVENIITLGNPGYKLHVYTARQANDPNAEPQEDVEGLRLVQQFGTRIFSEYSGASDFVAFAGRDSDFPGLDFMIAMTLLNLFTFGAAACEVELTESLDDIVDVYPVDPGLIDFWVEPETNRLVPGILIQGPFVPLDGVRFRYVAKDPSTNYPAGRSPLLPALDTVFFLQQFWQDLQAIVHMTNTARLDVKLVAETLAETIKQLYPQLDQPGQEAEKQAFIDGYMADLEDTINNLQPDDAFIHQDAVEVQFVGPAGTMIPIDKIFAAIDMQLVSATKQLPLLLGRNEGSTSTHATVQWQVYVENLKSYQRLAKTLAIWALNLYLRVIGRNSYAVIEFNEHKTSDEFLDAQTFNLNAVTWGEIVDRGWADQNEASNELLGHDATGTPKPVTAPVMGNPDAGVVKPPKAATNASVKPPETRSETRSDQVEQVTTEKQEIAALPDWISAQHASYQSQYNHWRSQDVIPVFAQASGEALRQSPDMTQEDMNKWLTEHLTLSSSLSTPLAAWINRTSISTYQASLTDNLKRAGVQQAANLTHPGILARLQAQSKSSAESIISTFNADLQSAINQQFEAIQASQNDMQGAGTDRDGGTTDSGPSLWQRVHDLLTWENLRSAWKSVQIGLSEVGKIVNQAAQDFAERSEVQGQAEVFPYISTHDICGEAIRGNPYESMHDALLLTSLPAHPNCPHFVRLIGSNVQVSDKVWTGTPDDEPNPETLSGE